MHFCEPLKKIKVSIIQTSNHMCDNGEKIKNIKNKRIKRTRAEENYSMAFKKLIKGPFLKG